MDAFLVINVKYYIYFKIFNTNQNEKLRKLSKNSKFNNYDLINKSVAKFLFNFLKKGGDNNNYNNNNNNNNKYAQSFEYSFPNIKFIDMVDYKFNHIHSTFNIEEFQKLYKNYGSYSKEYSHNLGKGILSIDVNFITNKKGFQNNSYFDKIKQTIKPFSFSARNIVDSEIKDNILNMQGFVKSLDYVNVLKGLNESVLDKLKAR